MGAPNPLVGEAEFRGLKLLMDFDRFCRLEQATGKKVQQLCDDFAMGLGLNDLRLWFSVFSVEDVTPAQIDAAIHQGGMWGDYAAANEKLGEMMAAFFAPPKEAKERPRKAA